MFLEESTGLASCTASPAFLGTGLVMCRAGFRSRLRCSPPFPAARYPRGLAAPQARSATGRGRCRPCPRRGGAASTEPARGHALRPCLARAPQPRFWLREAAPGPGGAAAFPGRRLPPRGGRAGGSGARTGSPRGTRDEAGSEKPPHGPGSACSRGRPGGGRGFRPGGAACPVPPPAGPEGARRLAALGAAAGGGGESPAGCCKRACSSRPSLQILRYRPAARGAPALCSVCHFLRLFGFS